MPTDERHNSQNTTHPLLLYYSSMWNTIPSLYTQPNYPPCFTIPPTTRRLLLHYTSKPKQISLLFTPSTQLHTLPQYKQNEPTTTLQYQKYLPTLHLSIYTLLHHFNYQTNVNIFILLLLSAFQFNDA